jgi:hypothetical protein
LAPEKVCQWFEVAYEKEVVEKDTQANMKRSRTENYDVQKYIALCHTWMNAWLDATVGMNY